MAGKRTAESLAAEKKYKASRAAKKPSASELAREFGLTESAIRKSTWFKAPTPRKKAA